PARPRRGPLPDTACSGPASAVTWTVSRVVGSSAACAGAAGRIQAWQDRARAAGAARARRAARGGRDGTDIGGSRHEGGRPRGRTRTERFGGFRPGVAVRGCRARAAARNGGRSEEHTSELQSRENLVCRLLLEKKKQNKKTTQ